MSLLKRVASLNVHSSEASIYTVPAGKVAVLIGANVSNKKNTLIKVTFKIKSNNVDYTMIKDLPIPPEAAFSFSGLEQKVVLQAGDQVIFGADQDNAGDVWLSMSEMEE